MKIALPYLLLFIAFHSFAQITIEHTYNNSAVTRIKLEYSGEKYYELKRETNELFIYNSNHSLWKTIILPATITHTLAPTAEIISVSETKINPDNNIEIIFVYYNTATNVKDCKIISENGNTLSTITNISSAELSEVSGLQDKLISTDGTASKVYSIPALTLEHTYTEGVIKRIILENSGEKYYLLDKKNNTAKIYNANHSIWKTISLPKPINTTYTDINFISETKINPDALVEIGYSYSETAGNNVVYSSKIVNENNVELLSVPNSRKLEISAINGLADKLIAERPFDFYTNKTDIYNLPLLTLKKEYESTITRVKLENSGEKYYTSYRPINDQLKIYNTDHSLWKTFPLTKSENAVPLSNAVNYVFISESKINSNASVEAVYNYYTGLLAFGAEVSSRIINEQGDILLEADYVRNLQLNEIAGLPNKVIGYALADPYSSGIGQVYSLNNLGTSDFNTNNKVIIYPIPAKSYLNISSFSAPIIKATIYNINGALVKKETAQNLTKIDVDKLPTGIYIVNLTDLNNQKSTHKITVSH